MSVDRRLRQGLHRNADVLEPEVDKFLSTVVHRTKRRVIVHRAVSAAALAAVVVGAFVVGPRFLDAIRSSELERPATSPSETSTPSVQTLTGTFARRLAPTAPAIRADRMAGRWTLALHQDGTMTVDAPPRFTGVLSRYQFRSQGSEFRTNLFVQDLCTGLPLGTYHWSRSGTELTFKVTDDQCGSRVVFFTSGAWQGTS